MAVAAPAPIRRLSQSVADAIAAGEVVERPASVIKELCENALDAGATAIDVAIEGGGLLRICVSDNGGGIAAEEMELAVARHATSKIAEIGDLAQVGTLGFRGEALASIAAVSEMAITSARDSDPAARFVVRGSEVIDRGAAARERGTTIEVRDLFFNTPARLRFLRTEKAEATAASRLVGELALAHPDVAISFRNETRTALKTSGGGLMSAAAAVFGNPASSELLELAAEGDIAVAGVICQPRNHRGSRSGLVVIVNNRVVHNRGLVFAIEEAYRGMLPVGRHPYGVVAVTLDVTDVDVNVHPTKREVRFRDERSVISAVQRACWHALQGSSTYASVLQWDSASAHSGVSMRPAWHVRDAARGGGLWPIDPAGAAAAQNAAGYDTAAGLALETAPALSTEIADLADLQLLGQIGTEWIVAGKPQMVVLIDPHAAHEKVLYQQLLANWGHDELGPHSDGSQQQMLLIPAMVECDQAQMEAFAQYSAWLHGSGLVLEEFGPTTLRCTAVPLAAANADATTLVVEILDSLSARDDDGTSRRHRIAALIACHSAVRFGDRLDPSEQEKLLAQLVATPNALTCPHGRPTAMVLDSATLRKAFRRPA